MAEAQMMLNWSEVDEVRTYGDWIVTTRSDQAVRHLMDRHYSRVTIGATQFTRPGENIVLRTADCSAVFIAWRTKYKRKDGYDCIENTAFRNESTYQSSDLIKMAVYAIVDIWGKLPTDGLLTYVSPNAVKSENPGYCYEKAGFIRQKKRSTRGLIPFLTSEKAMDLVLEEMGAVHILNACQRNIVAALESGEYMEAYEFQSLAEQQMFKLNGLKQSMKEMKLKAWSSYEKPFTKLDLDLVTDPYNHWMLDTKYFERKGLVLNA
ncbi:hypothetical protein [Anaerobacillus sp. 1_MG-2023]|uniref:hypothetical protein n=1 Tax=Anaerobacillus sp. 1_MG-2023 TaxID=3062655 RepID=UPI0026E3128F|nr:hypothetical protein [Anaerobacillus sp. 1_MG-2023]MDO6657497.1 hypothetical protein [Anaerobacillus sp. 1_MG-2023]